MNEDLDDACTNLKHCSSSSNEVVFENENSIVAVESEADAVSPLSRPKDTNQKSYLSKASSATTWIAIAVDNVETDQDNNAPSSLLLLQLTGRLFPRITDTLVEAKAAIAAQSRPLPPLAAQQCSLAKRQDRRQHVLAATAASSNDGISTPFNNAGTTAAASGTANDDVEEGMLDLTLIPALVASESAVTTERERFTQEVRERVKAEFTAATLVHVSRGSTDHWSSNDSVQLDQWHRVYVASFIVLLLVGIIVGAVIGIRSQSTSLEMTLAPTASSRSDAPSMAPIVILPNGKRAFTTTLDLYKAVDAYEAALQSSGTAENSDAAEMYGYPMGSWDVSRLTDFSRVFNRDRTERLDPTAPINGYVTLDEDLSDWTVSNAVNMHGMFAGANQFVGTGLENWDVGRVSDFSHMFMNADSFVGNLSLWDTSSATTMETMFAHALNFNGELTKWNVSRVRTMSFMFYFAPKVEGGDLTQWNVSQVESTAAMFCLASNFSGHVSTWDTRNLQSMHAMVRARKNDIVGYVARLLNLYCVVISFYSGVVFECGKVQWRFISLVRGQGSRYE
jgi:Mycoplasma protein of unknown function, DUF285